MTPSALITLCAVILLPSAAVPQVPTTPAQATDAALSQLAVEREAFHRRLPAEAERRAAHKQLLEHVESLRKQRASWNRDRKLRDARARAHASAQKRVGEARALGAAQASLAAARRRTLAAIDNERAHGAAEARGRVLLAHRKRIAGEMSPRGERPIRLPDTKIDELADPEELREQAGLIRQAESRLAREYEGLQQRERKYRLIASLNGARRRDAELAAFTGDDVRRTGRVRESPSANLGASPSAENNDTPQGGDPGPDTGNPGPDTGPDPDRGGAGFTGVAFIELSVVLAEVVDEGTERALRRAGRTSDADTRAEAASKAAEVVRARLDKLKADRRAIEQRVRKLRK